MEDLKSLMTCIDEISGQISDGMYLDMADKLKRIHDKLNGDKPFHEDQFYYSDDDSELDSNSDYESPRPARLGLRAPPFSPNLDQTRLSEIACLRTQLLDYVKKMHEEYKVLEKWEKEARRTFDPIKRMTAFRKSQAIKLWCEKNTRWASGGEAGELIGCGPIVTGFNFWTWKNLMENGLRTIVLEIGTDEEIIRAQRGFVYYDELSLKTLQKLPTFEKKIYDDYKEECQRKMTEYFNNAKLKVLEEQANMTKWEVLCVETEEKLTQIDACVYHRDYWEAATHEFWVAPGRMVDHGWEARVERRR
jgi:hypothetical protein